MGAKERREREKRQRKSQIFDTARALLLEKGLNAKHQPDRKNVPN